MTKTIAFPTPATGNANHKSQADQIIEIVANATSFPQGGPASYTDVRAWKRDNAQKEAPYTAIVLEFSATEVMTIGNGTADEIGLFGEIEGVGKFLIGVLGLGLGNTMPQIPIISPIVDATDSGIGYAIPVCNVAVYDALAVGGITGNIVFDGVEPLVTVRARPIRIRDFAG